MAVATRKDYTRVTVQVPTDLAHALNVLAAEEDRYVYELMEELLREALRRRKEQGRFDMGGPAQASV